MTSLPNVAFPPSSRSHFDVTSVCFVRRFVLIFVEFCGFQVHSLSENRHEGNEFRLNSCSMDILYCMYSFYL